MRPTAALAFALALTAALPGARAQDKPLPPEPPPAPIDPSDIDAVARARIERALDEHVTVAFADAALSDVVERVRELTRLDLVLDPDVPGDHAVALEVENATVRHLLDRALEGAGLQMRIFAGALVLTRPGKDLGDPPRLGADPIARRVAERMLSLNLDDAPLTDALDLVRDVTSLAVTVAPAAQNRVDWARTSLRLRDVALPHALTLLTHLHGLTWRVEAQGLVIDVRRPRERLVVPAPEALDGLSKQELERRLDARVEVGLVEGTLHDLAAQLEQRARLRVRVENAGKDDVVDLEFSEITVRDLLDIVCEVHGARWTIEEGVIVLQVVPRCGECGEVRGNVSPCPACGGR